MKRREFIKTSLAGTALVFIPGLGFFSCTKNSVQPTIDPLQLNFCSPVDIPEEQGGFYIQFIEGRQYKPDGLDLNTWRLQLSQTVNGQKIRETSLSFDEIASGYPNEESTFFQTFQCVGNPPGGFQLSNGYFTGVPLRLFLENDLGVDWSQANRVYFRCFDGYHTNHLKERIINDDPTPAYLAYKFNGVPFSDQRDGSMQHGYPVRMVIPDMLGMKSPKALTEIEVSDRGEEDGYWETRLVDSSNPNITWADIPPLKINSRIYDPVNYQKVSPGSVYKVRGVAVGGVGPVEKMEIGLSRVRGRNQIEGSISWRRAQIMDRPTGIARPEYDTSNGNAFSEALQKVNTNPWPAPFVWCLWEFDLQVPNSKGKYGLFARATDTAGNMQPLEEESVLAKADGNNAIHSLILQVE